METLPQWGTGLGRKGLHMLGWGWRLWLVRGGGLGGSVSGTCGWRATGSKQAGGCVLCACCCDFFGREVNTPDRVPQTHQEIVPASLALVSLLG